MPDLVQGHLLGAHGDAHDGDQCQHREGGEQTGGARGMARAGYGGAGALFGRRAPFGFGGTLDQHAG